MEFEKQPIENMTFTNHILERYVERTMGKTGNELKQFIAQNSDQVKEKILKLYEYSELFWYGKIKDHDFTYFTINRDGWVIVIDKNKTKLVTIYQVDLGLSSDFNKQYITEIKTYVENEMAEIDTMQQSYSSLIADNKEEIDKLKNENKQLQLQIDYNKETIELLQDTEAHSLNAISLKEKQLHKKIEKFIGAKIFE